MDDLILPLIQVGLQESFFVFDDLNKMKLKKEKEKKKGDFIRLI